MKHVIRPCARDDIIRQFRWYLIEQDASEAAFRFLDAVDESVGELLRMPEMGAPKAGITWSGSTWWASSTSCWKWDRDKLAVRGAKHDGCAIRSQSQVAGGMSRGQ